MSKLRPGASVTVWASGAKNAVHNPPTDFKSKRFQNWGTGNNTLTSLFSKNGEVVATFTQCKDIPVTESVTSPTGVKRKRTPDEEEPHTKQPKRQGIAVVSSSLVGCIKIIGVDVEGRFVQIQNLSDKAESVGGWKIVHKVESTEGQLDFKFHVKSKLEGGASVTVWASDAKDAVHNPPSDIIWRSVKNWGTGENTLTSLCTKNGEVVHLVSQHTDALITKSARGVDIELKGTGSHTFPFIPASSQSGKAHIQSAAVLPSPPSSSTSSGSLPMTAAHPTHQQTQDKDVHKQDNTSRVMAMLSAMIQKAQELFDIFSASTTAKPEGAKDLGLKVKFESDID